MMRRILIQIIWISLISSHALAETQSDLGNDPLAGIILTSTSQGLRFRDEMEDYFIHHLWVPGSNGGKMSLITKTPNVSPMNRVLLAANEANLNLPFRIKQIRTEVNAIIRNNPNLDYGEVIDSISEYGLNITTKESDLGLMSQLLFAITATSTPRRYYWTNHFPLSSDLRSNLVESMMHEAPRDRLAETLGRIKNDLKPRGSAPSIQRSRVVTQLDEALQLLENEAALLQYFRQLTGENLDEQSSRLQSHALKVQALIKSHKSYGESTLWLNRLNQILVSGSCHTPLAKMSVSLGLNK